MRLRDKLKVVLTLRKVLDALPDLSLMKEKLSSRKLWATVAGAALAALGTQLGLAPELVDQILTLLMVYIGGQAVVDTAAAIKTGKK